MSKLALNTVNFNGSNLILVNIDNKPHVALKPICENIGLNWQGQHDRVNRDPVLKATIRITRIVAEDGKTREMICLPLGMLNGWLFGIKATRVKPELREKLIQYQFECYDVLNNYWNGKTATSHTSNICADRINLTCLCSHMIWLEGWWSRYYAAVHAFNKNVAASVYDHFNDGSFVAAQFIHKYGLDVVPSKVARNFPWDADYQEKHDYYTLTRNEKR